MKKITESVPLKPAPESVETQPDTTLFRRIFPKLTPTQTELLAGIKYPCC